MNSHERQHRAILQSIAHKAMIERGLWPDLPADAQKQLGELDAPATGDTTIRDLRDLLWASIDNDDSRDLDQLTVAETTPGKAVKILVAIADVDSLVKRDCAIDRYAEHNTTSVYTAGEIFPMLPEKLSTDLTSLNPDEDRVSVVVEMTVGVDGTVEDSSICRALVRNKAKLAYNSVAAWLEGEGPIPEAITAVPGLEENLRIQDRVAQSMNELRHLHGALSLQTIQSKPVFDDGHLLDLEVQETNRAKAIIEDFMVAANGVTARYLATRGFPSIRRVVRVPKRWDRIVALADEHGFTLPNDPDSKALDRFLASEKAEDPLRFPDLSLSVVKLLGAGEYVAEAPGQTAPGHFGLAVKDYAHSTAPNRRYSDLITQRLLKAAMALKPSPYTVDELGDLARQCTEQEDAANKVERQVDKSAAALLLESRTAEVFDAVVTGASAKGTWARLLKIPAEGKVVRGFEGVDVGDRIRVQLLEVDVWRGFIDFARVGHVDRRVQHRTPR